MKDKKIRGRVKDTSQRQLQQNKRKKVGRGVFSGCREQNLMPVVMQLEQAALSCLTLI